MGSYSGFTDDLLEVEYSFDSTSSTTGTWNSATIVASTYTGNGWQDDLVSTESVSGTGKEGIDELIEQTKNFLDNKQISPKVYGAQIAFNVIPAGDILENNYTNEEMKMSFETNKILSKDIKLSASCVRVPVLYGHSLAVHVESLIEIKLSSFLIFHLKIKYLLYSRQNHIHNFFFQLKSSNYSKFLFGLGLIMANCKSLMGNLLRFSLKEDMILV